MFVELHKKLSQKEFDSTTFNSRPPYIITLQIQSLLDASKTFPEILASSHTLEQPAGETCLEELGKRRFKERIKCSKPDFGKVSRLLFIGQYYLHRNCDCYEALRCFLFYPDFETLNSRLGQLRLRVVCSGNLFLLISIISNVNSLQRRALSRKSHCRFENESRTQQYKFTNRAEFCKFCFQETAVVISQTFW